MAVFFLYMPSELRPATQTNSTSQVNTESQGERGGPNADVKLNDIMPIASYEGEVGHIYATDYYKMDTPVEFLDTPIREDLDVIDTFVKQYIRDENKEDTVLSYSKTLKALEKKIGIDDNTLRTEALKKVATLIKNYNKVSDAFNKNIKRKILAKLIRMNSEGKSSFDQNDYLLQQVGGLF